MAPAHLLESRSDKGAGLAFVLFHSLLFLLCPVAKAGAEGH